MINQFHLFLFVNLNIHTFHNFSRHFSPFIIWKTSFIFIFASIQKDWVCFEKKLFEEVKAIKRKKLSFSAIISYYLNITFRYAGSLKAL